MQFIQTKFARNVPTIQVNGMSVHKIKLVSVQFVVFMFLWGDLFIPISMQTQKLCCKRQEDQFQNEYNERYLAVLIL